MQFRENEIPSGLVNGTNASFLLDAVPAPTGSLLLMRNGVQQTIGVDFTVSGKAITFISGHIPGPADILRAWYRTEGGSEFPGAGGIYRDDAVLLIQEQLGHRTGLEAKIIRQMIVSQSTLQTKEDVPWFLIRSWLFSTNTQSVEVPGDFIREIYDQKPLWLLESDHSIPMEKEELDFLTNSADLRGAGKPAYYAILGRTLSLFQAPAQEYTFRLWYQGMDEALTSNIKNGWLTYAPNLLCSETGFNVARTLRDAEAAKFLQRNGRLVGRTF